jgi:putative ATP-binding cassette transporter
MVVNHCMLADGTTFSIVFNEKLVAAICMPYFPRHPATPGPLHKGGILALQQDCVMEKLLKYLKGFSPLKPLCKVGVFLFRSPAWLLRSRDYFLMLLAPLGRLLLAVATLFRLNRVLPWADLLLVAKPYWTGEARWKAFGLLFASLFFMVLNAKAAYFFGFQLKLLNDIVNGSSKSSDFYLAVSWLVGIAAVWALANACYGYCRSYLALDWRIWQSRLYMRQYVANEGYLRLTISNPDQRLAQDPDIFANTSVGLFMILVETIVNLWTFAPVLYQSSLLLTEVCLACALSSYVAILWLGRALPGLTYQQYDSEATLRTNLQDGPRYASSIAMQRCEPLLLARSIGLLGVVRQVLSRMIKVNLYVGFWNFFSGRVVENAALVGIGWLVMNGRATMGQIAQAGQAFSSVYNGLTVLTSQYGAFSTLKAELERLGPFARALEAVGANHMPAGRWIDFAETDSNVIAFENVTIFSSYLGAKAVVKDLTLNLDADTLITGRDGHNKTDMAGAIALGAAQGQGKITRPARDKIMFLTQTPYLPVCTLREYLSPSQEMGPEDDDHLLNVIELVGLSDLVEHSLGDRAEGLDTAHDWKSKLSIPQQQQLCLARAILSKPLVLIVDQATDGMEPEIEEDIFKVLRSLGVRLITFSNSGRLANWHKRVIELREDSGFDQFAAQDYKVPGWKSFLHRFGSNAA